MADVTVTPDLSGGILSAISAVASAAESALKEILEKQTLDNAPDVRKAAIAHMQAAERSRITAEVAARNLPGVQRDAGT